MLAAKMEDKLNQSGLMLIDFDGSSGTVSTLGNYVCKSPLIPGPNTSGSVLKDNNPFDIISHVIENEIIRKDEEPQSLKQNIYINDDFLVDVIAQCSKDNLNAYEPVNENCDIVEINDTSLTKSNELPKCIKMNSDVDYWKNNSCNELSQSLTNINNESDIKSIIAKRVSTCIQRALNSSCSQTDLRISNKPRTLHSRSMSDVNIKRNRSPEICINSKNYPPLMNSSLSIPNNQSNGCSDSNSLHQYRWRQFSFKENNKAADDNILPADSKPEICDTGNLVTNYERHVLDEAKKLSRMFSKLAQNSIRTEPEDLNDIMSIQPCWDELEFSDEGIDEDGLPALQLYHVHKRKSKTNSDSEALIRFKNRHRASLDLSTSDIKVEEDIKKKEMRRAQSDSSLLDQLPNTSEETQVIKPVAQPVVLPEPVNLKLRMKKPASDLPKKGPLKAMVPLQKMTRKFAEKISSPLKGAYQKSPSHSKVPGSSKKVMTPKDNSFLSSTPVAASTPNKQNGPGVTNNSFRSSESNTTPKSRLSRRNSSSIPSKRSSSVNSSYTRNSGSLNTTPVGQTQHVYDEDSKKSSNRPRTAPSSVANSRALADIPKSFTSPQNNQKKQFVGKLMSKLKRTAGCTPTRDKENHVIT